MKIFQRVLMMLVFVGVFVSGNVMAETSIVNSNYVLRDGTVWMITEEKMSETLIQEVLSFCTDDDVIYFLTSECIYKVSEKTIEEIAIEPLPLDRVTGFIWTGEKFIASIGNYLYFCEDGKITDIFNETITDLYSPGDGTVMVTTESGTFYQFNGENWDEITEEAGLDFIPEIVKKEDGYYFNGNCFFCFSEPATTWERHYYSYKVVWNNDKNAVIKVEFRKSHQYIGSIITGYLYLVDPSVVKNIMDNYLISDTRLSNSDPAMHNQKHSVVDNYYICVASTRSEHKIYNITAISMIDFSIILDVQGDNPIYERYDEFKLDEETNQLYVLDEDENKVYIE